MNLQFEERYNTPELYASLHRELPHLLGIGAFGSRVRGMHFPTSDLELVAITKEVPSCQKPESITSLCIELAKIARVPQVDLKLMSEETFMQPTYDPKQFSMHIELKPSHSLQIPNLFEKYSPVDFVTFLEYERLRNIDIFSTREADMHFRKKMPGARRSFDEIYWLSKLAGKSPHTYLSPALEEHLNALRIGIHDIDFKQQVLDAQPALDAIVHTLEQQLVSFDAPRGTSALQYLNPEVYTAYTSTDPEQLATLYAQVATIATPQDWLTLYAISFNPSLATETALTIATQRLPGKSTHSFRKILLQNRAASTSRFTEVINILKTDEHNIVRLYAHVREDPAYLLQLPSPQREFYMQTTSHIRS